MRFKLVFPSLGRRARAGDQPPDDDSLVPQFVDIVDNRWGPDVHSFIIISNYFEFYLYIIIISPKLIYFLMIIVPDEGILLYFMHIIGNNRVVRLYQSTCTKNIVNKVLTST